MKCKNVMNNLEAYFSEKLPEDKRKAMDDHLASCADCHRKLEESNQLEEFLAEIPMDDPDENLKNEFMDFIESERKRVMFLGSERSCVVWKRIVPLTAAASILFFALGYFGGRLFSKPGIEEEQIIALQDEIRETKNMMILNMLKQPSASKRIMAVNISEELDRLEPELREALFLSLNEDKSENVRLAALEALSRYAGVPEIREELVKSFSLQTDPIIQISMINMMVNLNEKTSVPVLEKLIDDMNTYESVKNQARQGLKLLL
jgi:hypothetical protein